MKNTDRIVVDFKCLRDKYLFCEFKFIKIKPYLSEDDIGAINAKCVEQFVDMTPYSSDGEYYDRYQLFPQIKMVFDTYVIALCTNLDINRTNTNDMICSKTIRRIVKKIYNYEEAWNMVLESIKLKNTYLGMAIIGSAMPTADVLNQNLQGMKDVFEQLKDKDPQFVSGLVKMSVDTLTRQNNKKEKVTKDSDKT